MVTTPTTPLYQGIRVGLLTWLVSGYIKDLIIYQKGVSLWELFML